MGPQKNSIRLGLGIMGANSSLRVLRGQKQKFSENLYLLTGCIQKD